MTRCDDEAYNPTKSTDHTAWAKFSDELRHRLNAILQRQNRCICSDKKSDRAGRLRHLPRFDAEDHEIDFANFADLIRGFRRMDYEIAIRTINPEPAGFDRP